MKNKAMMKRIICIFSLEYLLIINEILGLKYTLIFVTLLRNLFGGFNARIDTKKLKF